jgi:Fe-S-cluster containining protein
MKMDGFQCQRCGCCCRVPGYVRLESDEVDAIAACLGMFVQTFTSQFTRVIRERDMLSLVEKEDQSCIFLSPDRECMIQKVKPRQCRDFPHGWSVSSMLDLCEGMKRMKKEDNER